MSAQEITSSMPSQLRPREIAVLVPMAKVLHSLGFEVNERTKRCACILHGGSNPMAFSWREDGLWHCFSCQRGGDRITLVREVRKFDFVEAVQFLAGLAGVSFRAKAIAAGEIEKLKKRIESADAAAWLVEDRLVQLRTHYQSALHRTERLQVRLGTLVAGDQIADEQWSRLERLASASTFFLAAWTFLSKVDEGTLVRFVLASPRVRRRMIVDGPEVLNGNA